MFSEENLLPISALQHLRFCERQCALIHIEGLWAENRLTIEGRHLHTRVDSSAGAARGPGGRGSGGRRPQRAEIRGNVRTVRSLPLRSLQLGLIGKADAVEFHPSASAAAVGAPGTPFPVEYKRGRPKADLSDEVQLCAQALCLEEMLGLPIPRGALFYGRTRRRVEVEFNAELRRQTHGTIRRLHELVASGITPRARREKKCDRCSLLHLCLPDATAPHRSASRYVARTLASLPANAIPGRTSRPDAAS